MNRKLAAAALGLTMMIGTVLPAYAETTPINARVDSTYTLTIPAETTIAFGAAETGLDGVLKVTGNVLPSQKVTVEAECNALHNAVQNTNLPYTLKIKDGGTFTSAQWNEAELRAGLAGTGKEISLSVAITEAEWNKAEAGTYEGSIVFSAELVTGTAGE